MKKQVLILLSFLLLINSVSAVVIDLKETYSPGETLIAEIQGNFISPLQDKQIYFYEGRTPLPLLFDIGKFEDKYYLYALLPVEEKNLSLIIKDANFVEATKEYKQDLTKNFSVSGNLADFSVSPGFIITNQDFEVKVQSISKAVTVSTDFLGKQEQIYVSDSAIKKIRFSIQENSSLTQLKISTDSTSYTIPVLILSNLTLQTKEVSKLKFSPSSRDIPMTLNEERELNIRLENLGNVDLEDIKFVIPEIFKTMLVIEPENISVKQDNSTEIILKINSDQEGFFSDLIEAKTGDTSAFFTLTLSIAPEIINASNQQLPTCLSLKGQVCKIGQVCNETEADVVGGKCCLGACQEKTTSSSWIWILIIIITLLAIGYFLFKKYKKPGKSSSEILKEKQTRAETRLTKPGPEVMGKLDRF